MSTTEVVQPAQTGTGAETSNASERSNQSWRPYQNQFPFRRAVLDTLPHDAYGLYGLWFGRRCIYVGQAKSQPIARRLEQHWRRTHNEDLATWIKAKGPQLRVSYLIVDGSVDFDDLEEAYIKRFQPITNKQLK